MIERQDLHCTNCGRHVQFNMDFGLDGNHEITCPDCKHVHYRVVENGRITEERWRRRMPTYQVICTGTSATTYYLMGASTGTGASVAFLHDAWLQTLA